MTKRTVGVSGSFLTSVGPLSFLITFFCAGNLFAASPTSITVPANSTAKDIQAALDKLPDSGGEVILEAGVYQINQPIFLRRDSETLRGAGPATTLHLMDKADCPVVILGAPLGLPPMTIAHLRLADVQIDGNRKQQQVELWRTANDGGELENNGVTVWATSDSWVEHVICCRCRSGGLVAANGNRRLSVRDYTAFDNEYDGLACYNTEDSIFTQLFLHDNQAAGISLDLSFSHNIVSDAVLTGNELGVFMRETKNNIFRSLVIRKSSKLGVFMAQSGEQTARGWQPIPGTECTGNSFVGLMISESAGAAFRVNNTSCSNNVICGAQFLDNPKGGLAEVSTNLVTVQGLVER